MVKPAKIDDVKRSDKVTPSASARPIIVTNRPTLTVDPMMAPSDDGQKPDMPIQSLANHNAKTVEPLSPALAEKDEESEQPKELSRPDRAEDAVATTDTPVPSVLKPELPTSVLGIRDDQDATRDPEAAITAEEAAAAEAKAKREQELEDIIASGKYAVPIDAVQRRRSRAHTILLLMLAILLAIVLLDVVLDIGWVKPPSSVPHTHFFSD